MTFTTFDDVVDHGLDYLVSNPTDQARRDCVRAILSAYRGGQRSDFVFGFESAGKTKEKRLPLIPGTANHKMLNSKIFFCLRS